MKNNIINQIISLGILASSVILAVNLSGSNMVFTSYFCVLAVIELLRIIYLIALPIDYIDEGSAPEKIELFVRIAFLVCVYASSDGSLLGIGLRLIVLAIGVTWAIPLFRQEDEEDDYFRLRNT